MLFVKAGTFCLCPFLARVVFSLYSLTLWAPLYEEEGGQHCRSSCRFC